jgi:ATP-dependent DNA helicase RecQ
MMMLPKESAPENAELIRRNSWSDEGRYSGSSTKSAAGAQSVSAATAGADLGGLDEVLLARLKELRTRLAQEAHVPAYIIFSDASLRDMCRKKPLTPEQFLNVSGVGAVKMEKYGAVFTRLIEEYGRG